MYISPYFIRIENSLDIFQSVTLFGYDHIEGRENFGSDNGIKLSSYEGCSYILLLQQSKNIPFLTESFCFQSKDATVLDQVIKFVMRDEKTLREASMLIPLSYLKNNLSDNIVRLNMEWEISNKFYIELKMPPKTNLDFYVTPKPKIK